MIKFFSPYPYYFLFLFLFGFVLNAVAQNQSMEGEVSYVSSQNVYVKFSSTELIKVGDTLMVNDNEKLTPGLIVLQKSSLSVVGKAISGLSFQKGDLLTFSPPPARTKKVESIKDKPEEEQSDKVTDQTKKDSKTKTSESKEKGDINGRISVANYTTSGLGNTSNRFMSRLALQAKNIEGSNFSFNTYLNYRNSISGTPNRNNFNRVNLFQMNVTYQIDSNYTVSIGRKINNRMFSVGAIDGLHGEKQFNKFFVGGVAGFRPDPVNYGFNTNLFEYGGYVGLFHDDFKSTNTTIGLVDQRYRSATDRRYLFAQHSSNLTQNLFLFAMAEADLYQKDTMGNISSNLSPTNLFVSLQYRLSSKWRFFVSLDQRKNTILYESYAASLEQLSAVNPMRTGIRLRVNYQVFRKLAIGLFTNNRFQSDQKSKFLNIGSMVSLTSLGRRNASLTNTFSYNETAFFNYISNSLRYRQPLLKNKVSLSPFFRFLHYNYTMQNIPAFYQFYSGVDALAYFKYNFSLGLMYEYSLRQSNAFNRFNIQLIKRF